MTLNLTKKKLMEKKPVLGTMLTINSVENAQILAKLGYDYLLVDYEHGGMNIETLGQQILSIKNSPTSPLVRIPSNTSENVKKALDSGAYGIMLPMVKDRKDVEDFITYSNFPPKGIRGFGPGRASDFFLSAESYFEFEKDNILRIIQIETKEALDNIDQILSVEGIDVAFVGPYDLSFALGVPRDIKNKKVTEAIELVGQKCKEYGLSPGIMSNRDQVQEHLDMGYRFIMLGLDSLLLARAARDDIKLFEKTIRK